MPLLPLLRPRLLCLLGCLVLAGVVHAQDVTGRWRVREGTIKYEVSHVLHGAVGQSSRVQGELDCRTAVCSVHLSVPVASFGSGHAERDGDARALLESARFPLAEVRGTGRLLEPETAVVQGTVRLAGGQAALPPTRFRVERGWWSLRVRGQFALSLAELGIAPPALLGVPISDTVWIYVDLRFAAR
jgi:polyisoprenoid-binding protein YceI